MKRAIVTSAAVVGVDCVSLNVEVRVDEEARRGFVLVGIAESAVKETAARVRSALETIGCPVRGRVEVAVAPFDVRKDDVASLDFPIAVGILRATGKIQEVNPTFPILGELALDGTLRRIRGGLVVGRHARALGVGVYLPVESACEAAWHLMAGSPAYAVRSLGEYVELCGDGPSLAYSAPDLPLPTVSDAVDLSEVRGLEVARRAIEIAAAGRHNLLLIGPPGSGKSLLARCLPALLPPMTHEERFEVSEVYSIAGKLDGRLLGARPFRAPHHDVSVAGLVGGGPVPRPGEASLSHHGVLFLDELPEFKRPVLEALREPMRSGKVTIVRSSYALTYPSKFLLVGAMNPCPCGFFGSSLRACTCADDRLSRYVSRYMSREAPLYDRFDLVVYVPHVDYRTIAHGQTTEMSAVVRERVAVARDFKREREAEGIASMVECRASRRAHLELPEAAERFLEAAVKRFAMTPQDASRVTWVARTCADLAGREMISASDVAEAVSLSRVRA